MKEIESGKWKGRKNNGRQTERKRREKEREKEREEKKRSRKERTGRRKGEKKKGRQRDDTPIGMWEYRIRDNEIMGERDGGKIESDKDWYLAYLFCYHGQSFPQLIQVCHWTCMVVSGKNKHKTNFTPMNCLK